MHVAACASKLLCAVCACGPQQRLASSAAAKDNPGMFSALKGAVGVDLSDEVAHNFGSFHEIAANTIDNEPMTMAKYKGKLLIVANVACF